jgi:polysaccharide export outer membrane protein
MTLFRMIKLAGIAPALLLLAACVGSQPIGQNPIGPGPHVTTVAASELPPPGRADLTTANRAYYIGPYDRLEIDVFGVPELRRELQVDAAGKLAFPLVGNIDASGLTPAELSARIEESLRGRYVRDPQVTVNLRETQSQLVTVDGQVRSPGSFPLIGRMTLERAVARAGGTTDFARLSDVVVFRSVEGQQYAALYNLQAIRRGNYTDPEIYANDVIIVGDSPARRLFRDILQAAPLLTSPLVVLLNR